MERKQFHQIIQFIICYAFIFLEDKTLTIYFAPGEMAERFKAAVLKTVDPKGPGVRIPLSPQSPGYEPGFFYSTLLHLRFKSSKGTIFSCFQNLHKVKNNHHEITVLHHYLQFNRLLSFVCAVIQNRQLVYVFWQQCHFKKIKLVE